MTTKTKPQTKQEMSEWLAENVLGWEHYPDTFNRGRYFVRYMGTPKNRLLDYSFGNNGMSQLIATIQKFIYSPDGFFAVWDAVIEKFGVTISYGNKEIPWEIQVSNDPMDEYQRSMKDRYEAFYNAVYEAWE